MVQCEITTIVIACINTGIFTRTRKCHIRSNLLSNHTVVFVAIVIVGRVGSIIAAVPCIDTSFPVGFIKVFLWASIACEIWSNFGRSCCNCSRCIWYCFLFQLLVKLFWLAMFRYALRSLKCDFCVLCGIFGGTQQRALSLLVVFFVDRTPQSP